MKKLKDGNPEVRAESAMELGVKGNKEAVPHLTAALKDEYPLVRANTALALGHLDSSKKTVESIIGLLKDDSWIVRHDAAIALGELQAEEAEKRLIELLEDEVIDVRKQAVKALGNIGKGIKELEGYIDDENIREELVHAFSKNKSYDSLVRLYETGSQDIRIKAINGIKEPQEYVDVITKALKDDSWRVREEAASRLRGTDEAADALVNALEDDNSHVVVEALRSLADIGDEKVVKEIHHLKEHNDPSVREEWSRAMYKLRGDCTELLHAFQEEVNPRVRWTMAESIGRNEDCFDDLKEMYEQARGDEKLLLACSLAWAGDRTGVEEMLQAFEDNRWKVRQKSIEAVRMIPPDTFNKKEKERLIRGLSDLIEDPDKWVRIEAVKALTDMFTDNGEDIVDLLKERRKQEVDEDVNNILDEIDV